MRITKISVWSSRYDDEFVDVYGLNDRAAFKQLIWCINAYGYFYKELESSWIGDREVGKLIIYQDMEEFDTWTLHYKDIEVCEDTE